MEIYLPVRSIVKSEPTLLLNRTSRFIFLSYPFPQRLKATLTHQVSSINGGCGMVVSTASTMVTARPEQSQILMQHPDAPSPAQPQVSRGFG